MFSFLFTSHMMDDFIDLTLSLSLYSFYSEPGLPPIFLFHILYSFSSLSISRHRNLVQVCYHRDLLAVAMTMSTDSQGAVDFRTHPAKPNEPTVSLFSPRVRIFIGPYFNSLPHRIDRKGRTNV